MAAYKHAWDAYINYAPAQEEVLTQVTAHGKRFAERGPSEYSAAMHAYLSKHKIGHPHHAREISASIARCRVIIPPPSPDRLERDPTPPPPPPAAGSGSAAGPSGAAAGGSTKRPAWLEDITTINAEIFEGVHGRPPHGGEEFGVTFVHGAQQDIDARYPGELIMTVVFLDDVPEGGFSMHPVGFIPWCS